MTSSIEPLDLERPLPPVPGALLELEPSAADRRWRQLRTGGGIALLLWLGVLVAYSSVLYHRDFLGQDFSAYNQAWTLIGQGHLNPFDSVQGFPFFRNDFELIIWPLALLHLVDSNSATLLWIEDVTLVAACYVVFLWILDYLRDREVSIRSATAMAIGILAVLIVNPGNYQTLLADFHLETTVTLFLLLAGRDLWNGRFRRAWIWVGLTLLCGSFAAMTVAGLGISALLAGRATRRQGFGLIAAAAAWLVMISAVGANAGPGLDSYAYLAGRSSLPANAGSTVLAGVLFHPTRVTHMIASRMHSIYLLLKPVGVIGLASAWGFGVPMVVLLTSALNKSPIYIFEAFQNFAVFPFVLLGTVMVVTWLAGHLRYGWVVGGVVGLALFGQALAYGIATSPGDVRWAVAQVGAGEATQLRLGLDRTPTDAQVVSSIGVMGMYSSRPSVTVLRSGEIVPVKSRSFVFVLDPAHDVGVLSPSQSSAVYSYIHQQLKTTVLASGHGVEVLEWHPPKGTSALALPAGG